MYPKGKAREIFEAISKVNKFAYAETVHLANHVLSKTPCCASILDLYSRGVPPLKFSRVQVIGKVFKCWLINLTVLALMLMARIAQGMAGLNNSKDIKPNQRPLTVVDIFILVHRVLDQKKFVDSYFPGLYEELTKKGHHNIILARFYGTRNPRSLKKAFQILKKHPIPVITEYELFKASDWFALLKFAFVFPIKTICLVHKLEGELEQEIKNLNPSKQNEPLLSPLAYLCSALVQCLGQNYLSGESRRLAARRLAKLLPPNSRFISWYENQVVDKCFYRGFKEKNASFKTFAAQLLTWPDSLLNNHADPSDALHGAVPDTVLVNGPYFLPAPPHDSPGADYIATQTPGANPYRPYPGGPDYRIGPALRYKGLFGEEIIPNPEAPVLMLLSYHSEETERILALAKPLAAKGVPIAVKFHPATNWRQFEHLLPSEYIMINEPLKDALQQASLVIGSGSGALPEAVAMGVPAIAVNNKQGVALNYLPQYGESELWESISNVEEFFPAREKLMQALKNDPHGRTARIITFRALLFTEPTEERIVQAFEL